MKLPPEKVALLSAENLLSEDRDDFAEVGAEDLRIFFETFGGADEDDAFFLEVFLHAGVGRFGVELCFDTGEEFTLLFGNAEALEGFLYVVRHFIPGAGEAVALWRGSSGS